MPGDSVLHTKADQRRCKQQNAVNNLLTLFLRPQRDSATLNTPKIIVLAIKNSWQLR